MQTWGNGWDGWFLPSFLFCLFWTPVLLCDFHALPHGLAPDWAVICLLLPSVNVYATQFEVSFAGVFVSEKRAASSSLPSVSSPYKMSLGMRPGSMPLTWPSQRRHLLLSMANIQFMLALSCTSMSGTLSSQWMWRMRCRHL